jgi:hypothetical protein
MRTLLCCSAAVTALLAAGAAHATDIFAAAPAYPTAFSPVPLYNWTGLYVGVNGGAGFGNPTWASGPDSLWASSAARSVTIFRSSANRVGKTERILAS